MKEPAELYWEQLKDAGLTMAPLEQGLAAARGAATAVVGLSAPATTQVVPDVEHGHLVPARESARQSRTPRRTSSARSRPCPRSRELEELVGVVARAVDRRSRSRRSAARSGRSPPARPRTCRPGTRVAYHGMCTTPAIRLPPPPGSRPGRPPSCRVPRTPRPTRIAILPRCSLLYMSWCASATPSKPSVRHSTGRILP